MFLQNRLTTNPTVISYLSVQTFKPTNILKSISQLQHHENQNHHQFGSGVRLNEAVPQRRGGGRQGPGGRGKPKPCEEKENIDTCICEDGQTYRGFEEVKANCGRRTDNKPLSCECEDGSTWTRPEKPCGGGRNINECTCDGETYSGRRDIKRNCNPDNIESCECDNGETWTPSK